MASGWADYEHSHSIPDHEIHHSEDMVYRWNIIGNTDEITLDIPEKNRYTLYNCEDEGNYRAWLFYNEKIFDKQHFFFLDTIKLLV